MDQTRNALRNNTRHKSDSILLQFDKWFSGVKYISVKKYTAKFTVFVAPVTYLQFDVVKVSCYLHNLLFPRHGGYVCSHE